MNFRNMSESKNEYKKEIGIAIIVVVLIIGLWIGSWYYIDNNIHPSNCNTAVEDARGTFGDKFGAVNSLFAGLAFAGIIFTIFLQRKELQLQRKELEATREVFEKQNEMLSQEKFENTFFQMLSLFHSIVNSLDVRKKKDNSIVKTGRDCFEYFFKELQKSIDNQIDKKNLIISTQGGELLNRNTVSNECYINAYDIVYLDFRSDLSHYFRTYYHLIKFIDNSDIKDKQQYASIARAQLSSYEQILLFYNCMHVNGNQKFKPLIEKYSLFKNIDYSLLFSNTKEHLETFEKEAYGR